MLLHFISLGILAVSIFFFGFFMGRRSAVYPLKNITVMYDTETMKEIDDRMSVMKIRCTNVLGTFFIAILIMLVLLGISYYSLKTHYIESWRNKDIIEKVDYEYHKIDGKLTPVDSSVVYIENPDKMK